MARSLSLTAQRAIFAEETDKVFLFLIEMYRAVDMPQHLRIVNNTVNIVGPGGNTFLAYPFEIKLPDDNPEELVSVSITIDNLSPQIMQMMRLLTGPPSLTLWLVMAETPSIVEAGPFVFKMVNIDYDAMAITGTLAYENILDEPFPGDNFTASNHPSLFGVEEDVM